MRQLVVFASILAALFASTFLIFALAGGFGLEEARSIAAALAEIDPIWVGAMVVALLFADLFVAMPTLTLCIVAGHYLGPLVGGSLASTGMLLAGVSGYGISRRFGVALLRRLCRDEEKLKEVSALFEKRGATVLLLCRAAPIIPEVSCCLAGAARMPFGRFLAYFAMATIPYAFAAAFAGDRSSLDDARPALFAAIGISVSLWSLWWILLASWRKSGSRQ